MNLVLYLHQQKEKNVKKIEIKHSRVYYIIL